MGKIVKQPNGGALYRPDKGETPNPNGRPRRTLRVVLDEFAKKGYDRISIEDVRDAYERVINLTEEELGKLNNDKTAPMIVRIVGKALLEKRGFDILESMLDRAHGKATTPVKFDGNMEINYSEEMKRRVGKYAPQKDVSSQSH